MNKDINQSSITKSFAGKGVFPSRWAFTLLIPLRNIFLSPKQLIKRLELEENHHVLEIGPGPGYFSLPVARALKKGKLVLADIQSEMLQYAQKRISGKGLTNVEYSLCDGKSFPFTDASFDRIYMVTVIGEVENKEKYLQEFYRLLKKNGILSISEQAGDPDKMSIEGIKTLIAPSGLIFDKLYGNENNFTVNFKKH